MFITNSEELVCNARICLAALAFLGKHLAIVSGGLRPAVLPTDLDAVVDGLVPELQARGAFRTAYGETPLRARFGLTRPVSRYAAGARVDAVTAFNPALSGATA